MSSSILLNWVKAYRLSFLTGAALFLLTTVAGTVHASQIGRSPLHVITMWAEWAAALLLLPLFLTFGTMIRRKASTGPALLSRIYMTGLTLFGLDLIMRALFGLGWEPFIL